MPVVWAVQTIFHFTEKAFVNRFGLFYYSNARVHAILAVVN